MTQRTTHHFLLAALLGLSLNVSQAADKKEVADPVVKKSDAGICHDKASHSFSNTKKIHRICLHG